MKFLKNHILSITITFFVIGYILYTVYKDAKLPISALLFVIPTAIVLLESYFIKKKANCEIEKLKSDLQNHDHGGKVNTVEI